MIKLTDVEVTNDGTRINVTPIWAGVDRPVSFMWGLKPSHGRLADRLVRAVKAGVVIVNPHVKRDINGRSYVEFDLKVSGRHLNADLKRLGY